MRVGPGRAGEVVGGGGGESKGGRGRGHGSSAELKSHRRLLRRTTPPCSSRRGTTLRPPRSRSRRPAPAQYVACRLVRRFLPPAPPRAHADAQHTRARGLIAHRAPQPQVRTLVRVRAVDGAVFFKVTDDHVVRCRRVRRRAAVSPRVPSLSPPTPTNGALVFRGAPRAAAPPQCLQFHTDQMQDVKRFERLNRALNRAMAGLPVVDDEPEGALRTTARPSQVARAPDRGGGGASWGDGVLARAARTSAETGPGPAAPSTTPVSAAAGAAPAAAGSPWTTTGAPAPSIVQ